MGRNKKQRRLANISANNADNTIATAKNANNIIAIAPLIAITTSGVFERHERQKEAAVVALGNLTVNTIVIARDDDIAPLIALVTLGTDEQKEIAARVLRGLVAENLENTVFIARAGIEGLVVVLLYLTTLPREEVTQRVNILKVLGDVAKENIWRFHQALNTLKLRNHPPVLHSILKGNFTQEEKSAASNVLRAIIDIPTDPDHF